MASLIGRPLKVDAATQNLSRPSGARICVEVDLLKNLPNRLWIGQGDSVFWQPVVYENLPSYCPDCSRVGHPSGECLISSPNPQPMQHQIWRPKKLDLLSIDIPTTSRIRPTDKPRIVIDVPPSPDITTNQPPTQQPTASDVVLHLPLQLHEPLYTKPYFAPQFNLFPETLPHASFNLDK